MIRDWLIVGFVFAVLWLFWLWLGALFDAINEWHAALRREDLSANRERGSS
jgi:hypothetical protein